MAIEIVPVPEDGTDHFLILEDGVYYVVESIAKYDAANTGPAYLSILQKALTSNPPLDAVRVTFYGRGPVAAGAIHPVEGP